MTKPTKLEAKVEIKDMTNEIDGTGGWNDPWWATIELQQRADTDDDAEIELTITATGSTEADAKARCFAEVEKVCAALMRTVTKPANMDGTTAYLVGKRGKLRAHLWLGADTACTMWSSGGLKQSRYEVSETDGGREICQMCQHNAGKRQHGSDDGTDPR